MHADTAMLSRHSPFLQSLRARATDLERQKMSSHKKHPEIAFMALSFQILLPEVTFFVHGFQHDSLLAVAAAVQHNPYATALCPNGSEYFVLQSRDVIATAAAKYFSSITVLLPFSNYSHVIGLRICALKIILQLTAPFVNRLSRLFKINLTYRFESK